MPVKTSPLCCRRHCTPICCLVGRAQQSLARPICAAGIPSIGIALSSPRTWFLHLDHISTIQISQLHRHHMCGFINALFIWTPLFPQKRPVKEKRRRSPKLYHQKPFAPLRTLPLRNLLMGDADERRLPPRCAVSRTDDVVGFQSHGSSLG